MMQISLEKALIFRLAFLHKDFKIERVYLRSLIGFFLLDQRRKGNYGEHLRRPEKSTLKKYDSVGSIPNTK